MLVFLLAACEPDRSSSDDTAEPVQSWVHTQRFTASNQNANEVFGFRVAMDTDRAIISTLYEDGDDSGTQDDAGAAYIFERQADDVWRQTALLHASNLQAGDGFGYSIGIRGGYAVVNAAGEHGNGSGTLDAAGAVHVFHYE